jgi:hypothetical protein
MKYKELEKWNIRVLLENQPHLTPVFTSTLNVPERVKEYDDTLFLAFNNENGRFEIHSIDSVPTTYNATLPYKNLDARTVRYIRKNDIRVHGDLIHKRIEEQEQRAEKERERDAARRRQDFAKEFQSEFAKDAWNL